MEPFTPEELLTRWYRPENCWDCGAPIASAHTDGCDVARCLHTGLQRLSCGGMDESGVHDCGAAVHDGHWPGDRECAEYGWYLHFGDHVHPDLNRLIREGRWDRERGRWVPREGTFTGTVDAAMEWYVRGGLVVKTSELDTRVTVFRHPSRVVLPRQFAESAAWALNTAAESERDDAVLSDGRATIRVDRTQLRELAAILLKIHGQTGGTEVNGRTQVSCDDPAECRTQPRPDR